MKEKIGFLRLFLCFFVFSCFIAIAVQPAAAQTTKIQTMEDRWGAGNISDLYYVNVPVEKVFPYRLGYVVLYRKGTTELGRAYIPHEWFRHDVKKAQLVHLGDGKTWPCMSVFFKEGEFYGVRLYVAKRATHLTWGVIPSNVNMDDHFLGVESIDLSHNAGQQ